VFLYPRIRYDFQIEVHKKRTKEPLRHNPPMPWNPRLDCRGNLGTCETGRQRPRGIAQELDLDDDARELDLDDEDVDLLLGRIEINMDRINLVPEVISNKCLLPRRVASPPRLHATSSVTMERTGDLSISLAWRGPTFTPSAQRRGAAGLQLLMRRTSPAGLAHAMETGLEGDGGGGAYFREMVDATGNS
jgi:hypothetical protein